MRSGLALSLEQVQESGEDRKVQLRDAYASVENNEAWLMNAHIAEYSHGNQFNHSPVRPRKLLLHRREIDKLHATRKILALEVAGCI